MQLHELNFIFKLEMEYLQTITFSIMPLKSCHFYASVTK